MQYVGMMAITAAAVILILHKLTKSPPLFEEEHPAWPRNMSRDTRVYVKPDDNTTILEPKDICLDPKAKKPIHMLLVVVNSAAANFDLRAEVRRTWASKGGMRIPEENFLIKDELKNETRLSVREKRDKNVFRGSFRVVFVLGLPAAEKNQNMIQNKIKKEADKYGDIIQEDFVDSYHNMTIKSTMILKWITKKCGESFRFILKTNDDVVVNVQSMLKKLNFMTPPKNTIIGKFQCDAPVRNASSKWYCPRYIYPKKMFPCYLSGSGYIFTSAVAKKLYEAALRSPLLHLEDVYITGVCALNASPPVSLLDDWFMEQFSKEKSVIFKLEAFLEKQNVNSMERVLF